MARGIMNASVPVTRAVLILFACLIFGTFIGLLPDHNSGQNLRNASGQGEQQQQQSLTRGSGIIASQLRDVNLFSRFALPAEEDNRVEVNNFVWKGDFPDIHQQGLDTYDFSMSFSFDFEGSFSYDYYY